MPEKFHYLRFWDYADKNIIREYFKKIGAVNSFLEYQRHPLVSDYIRSLSDGYTTAEINTQAQVMFHLYQMFSNGEKILKVESDLALQLFHTEIRGIKAEHLKAPFKEFYISIPHGLQTISIPGKKDCPVEGIYVFLSRLDSGDKEFRVMVVGSGPETSKNKIDDAVTYFRVYLKDSEDIQSALDKELKAFTSGPESALVNGEFNQDKIPSIANFVVNVLLYSTSPNADIRWQSWMDIDPKIKKLSGKALERRKAELRKRHMLAGVLGGNLRLSKEERNLYLDRMRNKTTPIGVSVLVRGHWRNQWYGSELVGDKVQKPKFIEPYWKGLNNEIVSNKIQVLV